LYEHLSSHEAIEGEMLVEYRDVAAASPSEAFRYLSDLIIEDEIRHHRIFRDLAAALKDTTPPPSWVSPRTCSSANAPTPPSSANWPRS
jgi:rubrerythrin